MRVTRYLRIPLIGLVVFLLLGILAEKYILSGGIRQQDIKRFTNTLHRKQAKVEKIMNDAVFLLDSVDTSSIGEVFETMKKSNELFEHKEMTILITQNDELVYWSDHVVGFHDEISSAVEGFVLLPNGWFVLSRITHNDYVINGLTLIKYNYQIENDYLRNTFARGFHLPNNFQVNFYNTDDTYPIFDKQNRFLFSIEPSGQLPCIYSDLYIPVVLYAIAIFFLFIVLYRFITHYFHRYTELKLMLLLGFLVGFYYLMNQTGLPRSVYLLNLFSPKHFAYSSFWTSLGEYLVFTIILLFWGVAYLRTFDIAKKLKINRLKRILSLSAWLLQIAVLFVFIRFMIYILVMNSSISFSVYRIEDISLYSLLGFIAIGFLFLAFFLIAFRTTQVFRKSTSVKEFLIILSLITIVVSVLLLFIEPIGRLRLSVFFWLITATCFLVSKYNIINHRLSLIVLFVFIFTLFTLSTLIDFQTKSEKRIQELMVMNLSVEHDPMAELFLRDIDEQIKNDTAIIRFLYPPFDVAKEYIARKYMGGYMRGYDLQFTVCHANDSVFVQPESILKPCFPFFDELLDRSGAEIQGTNFYFLDNMNGRITYFGKYDFEMGNLQPPTTLFIELNSKLLSEGTGFPELLLPSHSFENRLKGNFSFAKYNRGELVDRGGDYLYALTLKAYQLPAEELGFKTWDGYEHCIYALGDRSYIIVSRKDVRIYDYFIAFPYVFVFLFILSMFINFATKPYLRFTPISSSLRMRIQLSIIGVVFVALLVVGSGTIYYIISQYRSNHRKDLIDKINSVSVELDMIMGNVEGFDDDLVQFLYYELVRISDIFWTDVNIYDLQGRLVSTSRPEIFEKGLISTQMDNTAIFHLNKYEPTRFLHNEHIAKMKYLSAYVPLINRSGQNFGYINIPYFTKQREFTQQITTFILAFINIYVFLLMVSVLVAYIISSRITLPLKLVRDNLRSVQLGKETKPIEYKSVDEIGLLVSEYNNKLEELAYSTDLLARSERETAWREMAKQIAHEIKNPLTPMKLNIQFLQRSDPNKDTDYQEKVRKVTEALIEQIDNLSAIATEFSNFAQIPRATNEEFNLTQRLLEIIKLYNYTGQVEITTHFKGNENLMVFADKEQFSRAILNLIKNSIQAIPENRKGLIDIDLKKNNGTAIITIKDNGKGISENLNESIFVPNFTTKSSGTGLGLAIARNIVENFKGEIWFESEVDKGTRFFIRIPLATRTSL